MEDRYRRERERVQKASTVGLCCVEDLRRSVAYRDENHYNRRGIRRKEEGYSGESNTKQPINNTKQMIKEIASLFLAFSSSGIKKKGRSVLRKGKR